MPKWKLDQSYRRETHLRGEEYLSNSPPFPVAVLKTAFPKRGSPGHYLSFPQSSEEAKEYKVTDAKEF